MTGTHAGEAGEASRACGVPGRGSGGRGRGRLPRALCALLLAVPVALLLVRLTGADSGTPLAVPLALFPHAAVLALPALVLTAGFRRQRSWPIAAVALVVLAAHVWLLAPRFVPDDVRTPPGAAQLRVLTLNTEAGGVDPRAVVALVRAERIDVLALEQTPAAGIAALDRAGLGQLLPHREAHPEHDSSLFSRLPLTGAGATDGDTAWPQTTAGVVVGGRTVRFVAVHTYYPLGDAGRWTRDLDALASLARKEGPDTVFLGDFNATLDHAPMRRLLAAGLTDVHAELGEGWAPTWPADATFVPPLVQLDHVLHGPGLAGVSVSRHPLPGTDHLGVVAVLAVLPAGAGDRG